MTLDQIVKLVKRLSLLDKVRLIERVAPEIEQELKTFRSTRRKSLWGLCSDLGNAPSEDEIDRTRNEM